MSKNPKKIISKSKVTAKKQTAIAPSQDVTKIVLNSREEVFPTKLKLQKTTRKFLRLTADDVFRTCQSGDIPEPKATKSKPNYDIISQERAVRAINFGLGVNKPGYNIYVAGVQGTGKTSVMRSFLMKTAQKQTTPLDWIYVYNFKSIESPRAIGVPTGVAKKFKKDMENLIETLSKEITDALQSEDYETNVNATVNISNDKKTKLFVELEKSAKGMNFGVKSTRMGIVTVPIVEGKPLSEKDYSDLTDEQKERIEADRNQLEPEVLDFARKVRAIEAETKQKLDEIKSKIGGYVVGNAMESLFKFYEANKNLIIYLKEVKEHILENLDGFVTERAEESDEEGQEESATSLLLKKQDQHLPYRVNVFVDNTGTKGAPIIIESNPTFYNLFGKIEKNIEYGVYTTDFKMIKAGALARANGGFLVLNALDVFKNPHVWDTLKRVLKNQKIFIEDLGEQFSLLPTSGLRPEPIPLNVKIVLIGSDWLYRMLYQFDEDFPKIFKIKADFDSEMSWDKENVQAIAKFVSDRSKVEDLLPFEKSGIAAIIEFASRVVSDQDRLTTRFSLLKDLTIESDFIARERSAQKIERTDVEKAISERYFRSALVEDRLNELIERGDILLSTNTRRIGEINGLAVYSMGDVSFGKPTRITCRVYKGKPGILNIERDAALSGKIHNKGISILTSWIHSVFGRKKAAEVSATICFEQNYSGIDGDSATLAQLCLVLSSIAQIPIDQSIAVTGSANQFGEVQPIGGVNEKIEGFFKTCQMKGLTGRQGVIIPKLNVKHLVLNHEVRQAIARNDFHVWAVESVEEAFELLTGFSTGEWDETTQAFTPSTAFQLIDKLVHQNATATNKTNTKRDRKSP